MRKLFWFAAWFILIAPPQDFGQSSGKVGWGPWRCTCKNETPWSGTPFRSKCNSNSGGDSKWTYQFRSHYGGPVDFVARVEHGVDGAMTNELDRREAYSLDGYALSPVFETVLHGTCEQLAEQKHELRIEVVCVADPYQVREGADGCFNDENGIQVDRKQNPTEKQN